MIQELVGTAILERLSNTTLVGSALRQKAVELLAEIPDYDWCGIYRLEGDTLVLDSFVGEPTEHTHIKVGVGICGTAVAENQNIVVEDVSKVENYLSCSVKTKSEIVVLIYNQEADILGQIDIDGHRVNAFETSDEAFLQLIANLLASRWNEDGSATI
jgi:GAF domain-containing protein